MDAQTLSIYLHIPFCSTMCTYCAFNTYVDLNHIIPAFVDALAKEIRYIGATNPYHSVETVFFGGGTPSILTYEQYYTLFQALHDNFYIKPTAEITLESNPNDLNKTYLSELSQVGFNRISMGMQTNDPDQLRLFNREHTTQDVIKAVNDAQKVGFDNISMDLIFGSPHQSLKSWRDTLTQVIDLNIQNVSAYNLILEGNTPLKDDVDAGILPQPDDDLSADMYDLMTDMLAGAGFQQYEISNWAKHGFQSRHNIQYWHNAPYLGLGPGAHGFADGVRYIVTRSPQKYINAMQNTEQNLDFPRTPAVSKATPLTREDEIQETIMMGMRLTQDGIDRQRFQSRFGIDILAHRHQAIEKYQEYGLLEVTDERIRLTDAGRFLSNAVIRDLI